MCIRDSPWVDSKGKVRETAYCQYLLEKHPMMCLKQKLFDQNGEVDAVSYTHLQRQHGLVTGGAVQLHPDHIVILFSCYTAEQRFRLSLIHI